MFLLIILIIVLNSIVNSQSFNASVSGRIINSADKSPLMNANVIVKSSPMFDEYFTAGAVTDSGGRYKILLPYGSFILKVSYVGFETYEQLFDVTKEKSSAVINIELNQTAIPEDEITVTGEREQPSTVIQKIEPKDLKRIPTLYNDVLRAVQILPGVSTSSELSSGYNVRGGNFDDNLIYLNGFEIYRPFLLRQGIEENKTLINPDLVEGFRFYNGSFPASYGDKMSSALEVNYELNSKDTSGASVKIDLLNASVSARKNFGDFKIALAARYAFPGLFLSKLQTDGDYKTSFRDIQLFADYDFNQDNKLEVLFLYAENKFDLTPANWIGHFGGFTRGDIRALDIFYNGEREYSFTTGLLGLKYSSLLNQNIHLTISAARYSTIEDEFSDLYSEFYYRQSAENTSVSEFIKSGRENVSNRLDLVSYEFSPEVKIKAGSHLFTAGLNFRLNDLSNKINEKFSESSDTTISDLPLNRFIDEIFKLNSFSAFVQDDFKIFEKVFINTGIRTTYYEFNDEFLFSPRTTLVYIPSVIHNFSISWGYYYQPPYYNELRNKKAVDIESLRAQKSVHYSAGWEFQFKEKMRMNLEAYYKDLDNLIPYYIDREKTEYLNQNSNKGFAYGFDLMFQGEIVEGMNSWIGYGYLNTEERNKLTGEPYRRRLTDQTHTLQMFLQDKIKKHPNWQVHTRLLFGSGFLYNLRDRVADPETGKEYLAVSPDKVNEFFIYFRIDMGLSASFNIDNSKDLVVVAEVMNLFNHLNYGGYRFVQISSGDPSGNNAKRIFPIPQVLSRRFFNVSLELRF